MGVRWWVVGPVEYIILIYVLNRFSNGAYFLKNNSRDHEKFEGLYVVHSHHIPSHTYLSPFLKFKFWHYLIPPHYTNSQNSIISFGYVYFSATYSITGIAIVKFRLSEKHTKFEKKWF